MITTDPHNPSTPLASLVFIGDRPAQMAALVLDAPVTYTADRADPFMVQRLVESYVGSLDSSVVTQRRRIVLSTGLTWAPKYDGMTARQVNTLIQAPLVALAPLVPPRIYVLPVSSSHVLGHALNVKLDLMCDGTASRRASALFLGGPLPLWSFLGSVGDGASPLSPTPVEILALADVLKNLIKLDNKV